VGPAAPSISVIIPSNNQGHLLGDAIASVWRSARRDVEILVIDDGSTDDTPAVGRSFGGVRCISQPRLGRSAAFNRGLAESRGQSIVFLDADTQLAPGALDIGAAELDAHAMAAFVFGRCRIDGDTNGSPAGARPRADRQYYRELLTRNVIGPISTVMFRRGSIERVGGFDRSVDAAAEYGLYLRIARTNRIHDHAQLVACATARNGHARASVASTLQDTLTVLRRERASIESDPSLLAAYHEGWRCSRDYYGALLATDIASSVRAREWRAVVTKTLQFGWLHPRGAGQHAARKLAATVAAAAPRIRRASPNS
jgi:glycosyltransferase involved in cell wall biosynthesis